MKFYRFEAAGRIRFGVLHANLLWDAAKLFDSSGDTAPDAVVDADFRKIAAAPDVVVHNLALFLKEIRPNPKADYIHSFELDEVRILAPMPTPEKFICVGLNYMDHCEEQQKEPPKSPVLFGKYANAIVGSGAQVRKPETTQRLDFEGELGVVIGRGGRAISASSALEHVFGYTIINDLSARDLQRQDGQFLRGKNQDGFAPMGPCIVTADEIPDPQSLAIRTTVNEQVMQDSNTSRMIFGVAKLIEFISEGMTLSPGDIISTGTPSGVGEHRKPSVFLTAGDVVRIEVEKIGTLINQIV